MDFRSTQTTQLWYFLYFFVRLGSFKTFCPKRDRALNNEYSRNPRETKLYGRNYRDIVSLEFWADFSQIGSESKSDSTLVQKSPPLIGLTIPYIRSMIPTQTEAKRVICKKYRFADNFEEIENRSTHQRKPLLRSWKFLYKLFSKINSERSGRGVYEIIDILPSELSKD